jgi:hypothetical protein
MKKQIALMLIIFTPFIFSQFLYNSWIELDPGVNTSLNCVRVNSSHFPGIIWICGNNGVILRSSSENETWQKVNAGIPKEINLVTISVKDSAILAAGNIGNNTYVYRSSDEGTSWHLVFSQQGGRINSIINSYDTLTGFYMSGNPVAGRWSVWKSYNYGLTWDSAGMYVPQSGNETGLPNCMTEGDSFIVFGTNNSSIYSLSLSGFNWQRYSVPEQTVYTIIFFGGHWYATGNNLLYSSNNGNNWINKNSAGTGPIKSMMYHMDFMPGIYACGPYYIWYTRGNKIYYSCDNINWRAEHTSSKGNYTSLSNNTFYLYAVTDAGRISKLIAGIDSASSPPPHSFFLMQNFPNPFNAYTIIKLKIYNSVNLKISIYNSAGELINSLYSDHKSDYSSSLNYFFFLEYNWDGTNYPSGVYFCQVAADDYKETIRMLLVK